jgi:hypothetical protein
MYSTISTRTLACSSIEFTQAEVLRTLRNSYDIFGSTDARLELDAYARSVGAYVASFDREAGVFLTSEQADEEGAAMAVRTLYVWRVCTTDDPRGFCRRFQGAFFDGYLDYVTAARTYDGVTF